MFLETFTNPKDYKAAVFPFLMRDEAQNCLAIGVVETLVNRPEHHEEFYLACVRKNSGGPIVAVAWHTPPNGIGVVSDDTDEKALGLIADFCLTFKVRPSECFGSIRVGEGFAKIWLQRTKGSICSTMRQGLYKLTEVIKPRQVDGQMRLAAANDRALLDDWHLAFAVDCKIPLSAQRAKEMSELSLKAKDRFFWEVGKKVVSMAGVTGSTPSGVRVGYVYTPKDERGQGYASALVAELSQTQLDAGKKMCFLYTDLDNPTSNRIYQNIGYRRMGDAVLIGFKY